MMRARACIVALMALAWPAAASAQDDGGFQLVADNWNNALTAQEMGRNYGLGLRMLWGESHVRGMVSVDFMLFHPGPGSILLIFPAAGLQASPLGKDAPYWPYALGAFACKGPSGTPDCAPVLGFGVMKTQGTRFYIDVQSYRPFSGLRTVVTLGVLFGT